MKPGMKFDDKKLQYDLVPWEEFNEAVKVLMLGAEKYAPDNWQKVKPRRRYRNALLRHVVQYLFQKDDEESGIHHLAHAICNCLFLMWADRQRKIYIAGPMTGYDNHNFSAFLAAEEKLTNEGWEVENPARISQQVFQQYDEPSYPEFMKADIKAILTCDAMYFLKGWEKSKGACFEKSIAEMLNMDMYYE